MILEHLPCPWPGIILEIVTTITSLSAADFHSFAWPSGHFSCPSPHLISHPFQVPCLHLPPMTILFPLLSEIEASLLGHLFLFSFFGSVECNVVPAFSANIHLQVGTYIYETSGKVLKAPSPHLHSCYLRTQNHLTSAILLDGIQSLQD